MAEYHLKKLLDGGLVKQGNEGFVVDRVVWGNMIRMKRTLVPFQAVYSLFFASAFLVMLVIFRNLPTQGYAFGLVIVGVGFGLSMYETMKALKRSP